MNIFRKQFRRGAVSTALFVLLLAVGMAFCSIGAAAWFTTRSQIADMKKRYTTVAVPAGQSDNMGYMFLSFNSLFGVASEEQWTPLTEQEDHQYPGLLAEDVRGFLMAHVSGCESVSPYERYEPEEYTKSLFYDASSCKFDSYNNSLMVLALRCESVSDMTDSDEVYNKAVWDDNGEINGSEEVCEKHYAVDFVMEDVVCRFPGYETIPGDIEIWLSSWLYTEGGRMKSLQVSNVTYTYQSKYHAVHALNGVDAKFLPGHMYAVAGASGSGKTTLLSLLAGLDVPLQIRDRKVIDGKGVGREKEWEAALMGKCVWADGLRATG